MSTNKNICVNPIDCYPRQNNLSHKIEQEDLELTILSRYLRCPDCGSRRIDLMVGDGCYYWECRSCGHDGNEKDKPCEALIAWHKEKSHRL